MTQNQIAYWGLQETKRSNRARETETHRTNVVYEKETNRHNVATEQETNRHNLATELLQTQANSETARHNAANEMVANFNAQEAARANKANESLKHEATMASYQVGMAQVGLGYAQLGEQNRHNVEGENLTKFSNSENARSNRENEYMKSQQLEIERGKAANQAATNTLNAASSATSATVRVGELAETSKQNAHKRKIDWANYALNVADKLTSVAKNASGLLY